VALKRVIALAGVCDLAGAYRDWHGGAVRDFIGGSPERMPERYTVADPLRSVPLSLPVLLVHGVEDETVSVELSRSYERAAAAAGGEVELVEIEGEAGSHRAHVDPRGAAWAAVLRWLEKPVEDRARRVTAMRD
jgi:dipeptidyl aminopeptidase/acylaminoacyl peptidase